MAICRGNCKDYWLLGKYAQSDFEPEKPTTKPPENSNKATRKHWHVLRVERFKNRATMVIF
ncbi:hypothetical protein VIBRN418_08197 [Vibrio sp. N418]|nr:hypothetical protein VIBRN418_08197 [Vibrio sp. N418]